MAYDERLAARVRKLLAPQDGLSDKKMFGGISFMLRGNMCCGVNGDRMMVRVGPDAYEKALSLKHAKPMDFTGKPLRGFVYVESEGVKTAKQIQAWVDRGLKFVKGLPSK